MKKIKIGFLLIIGLAVGYVAYNFLLGFYDGYTNTKNIRTETQTVESTIIE